MTAIVPAAAQSTGIADLGTLPGGSYSFANDISADGRVVVGYGNATGGNRAFRWTLASGAMTSLGTLPGGLYSIAQGVNADGSVVVGYGDDVGGQRAFRWTLASGTMTSLGTLPGGFYSIANGVSDDGSVVVGYGNTAGANRAFRWTLASGAMTSLSVMIGGTFSHAQGVNADGSVVVGYGDNATSGGANRAFRWTLASGAMTSLGVMTGGTFSRANAVNSDGSVVVGYGDDGTSGSGIRAFRWTLASGTMTGLGTLPGAPTSIASAVNADGSVVVGFSGTAVTTRGFRWTQASGMITVEQWLRNNGAVIPADITAKASGVSADGNVVVGTLANNHAYIARVVPSAPPPGPGPTPTPTPTSQPVAALMDVVNFYTSLAGLPRAGAQLQTADLTVNGAHSSPLYTLLAPGQSAVWTAGDAAISNGRAFDTSIGLGELGIAHGLAPGITLRAAMGGSFSRQNLVFGGEGTLNSTYVVPEITVALGGNLYASGAGYLSWGDQTLRRAYSNGVTADVSLGTTSTHTDGFRARLDWKDAATLAATTLSPYASLSRFTGRLDGYTETGGGFPVRVDAAKEVSTVARIGGDTLTPLTSWASLIGRLEYAHRFETATTGLSGQILGFGSFDFAGATVRQDWGRVGVGVRYKLGPGDGVVMANASNQTGRATGWLSASYRIVF